MNKKLLIFSVAVLLSASFASAVYYPNGSGNGVARSGEMEPGMMYAMGTGNGNGQVMQARALQGQGQMMLQSGKQLNYSEFGERMRLRVGNFSADCEEECNLTQNQSRLHATMSNGRRAEIKVMPDVAAERALERLRLRNCNESQGCQIELKQVGEGNMSKMAYEVRREARARVLGIFKTNVDVEAQVDAETGEIIRTRKPWWASIIREDSE